jgi:transposase
MLGGRTRPFSIIAEQASFHHSSVVREGVRAHRTQIRLFFFPPPAPELNPDEQVWNELKHRRMGKQPIQNKIDLKTRIRSVLKSWQLKVEKIRSFFQLSGPKYAAILEAAT